MAKFRDILIIFIILFFPFPISVLASSEFSDYYNVVYQINPDGKTLVTQNISIVNNATDVYAADYTIKIGSEGISDIKARDRVGELSPEVSVAGGSTSIKVVFKDKVVGAKRSLSWTLSYLVSDISIHNGTVWEVTIPRLSLQPEIKSYDLKLIVPKSFGPEMYISPSVEKYSETDDEYNYTFKKESFETTGIMAAFGTAQRFNLELTYHLKNPSLLSSAVEIAFPPDIFGEQAIEVESILPKPDSIKVDVDGNYLAKYSLPSGQEKEIKLIAKVYLTYKNADLSKSGNIEDIPDNLRELYTQADKYWESTDPEIKTLAAGIIRKDLTAAENSRLLYQYVVSNLKYNWDSVKNNQGLQRKGAKAVLQIKDQAVCMEFADLYIALLRSVGIPARRAAGYAYSQNYLTQPIPGDSLHTWVQVYIPKIGWISTDPTWGSTTNGLDYFSKLDTNHIVFSINGTNSEFPFPAGTYKIKPEQQGDLKVSFIEDYYYFPSEPKLHLFQKDDVFILANRPNNLGAAAADVELRIKGEKNNLNQFIGTIPAYSEMKAANIVYEVSPLSVNITYKRFDGSLISEDSLIELKPFGQAVIIKNVFYRILPLGLFLCMIVGILVIILVFRKKLPDRPQARPPVQGQ